MPLRLLDGFKGTLQTDGYAGYNRVCRENGLTRIGCWDHARRKFVEASKAAPVKKKGTKVSKADVAIGKIRKLYAIEKRIERCQPWRAKRRLVDPSSREAALFSRRALRQRENKVGLRTRRPVIGSQVRSSNELAKLLRSAW